MCICVWVCVHIHAFIQGISILYIHMHTHYVCTHRHTKIYNAFFCDENALNLLLEICINKILSAVWIIFSSEKLTKLNITPSVLSFKRGRSRCFSVKTLSGRQVCTQTNLWAFLPMKDECLEKGNEILHFIRELKSTGRLAIFVKIKEKTVSVFKVLLGRNCCS